MKLINADKITDDMIAEYLGVDGAFFHNNIKMMLFDIDAINPINVCCAECKHAIEMEDGKRMCKRKMKEIGYVDFCDCCEYWDME